MVNLLNFLRKRKHRQTEFGREKGGRARLLKSLLKARGGLTVDQLVGQLGLTRSAVHQTLVSLERDGLVERRQLTPTKGRPGQVFALTDAGIHQFPKRYDWFSTLLLSVLSRRLDGDELRAELSALGSNIGDQLRSQSEGNVPLSLETVADAMSDLGYVARSYENEDGPGGEIEAFNCVYHHLAVDHPDVCEFDLAILERAIGMRPEHIECMVRGGGSCRFRFSS